MLKNDSDMPRSFLSELVMSIVTSRFSSSKSIEPRYPIRLSVKRGETTNFITSICPKCAGKPSMWTYRSLATLRHLASALKGIENYEQDAVPENWVFFPEAVSNFGAFFLDHFPFLGGGATRSNISDQIPKPNRRWHF